MSELRLAQLREATEACRSRAIGPGWWALLLTSVLTYMLISASLEFGEYAPLAVTRPALYAGFVAAGFIMGWTCRNMGRALLLTAVVLFSPLLLYGAAMVALPVIMGGMGFLDLLIMWAVQRVLVYLLLASILGFVGITLGVFISVISHG
ncbi:MAG: hypothetical protein AB1445_14010 [Bacillota bacterium]